MLAVGSNRNNTSTICKLEDYICLAEVQGNEMWKNLNLPLFLKFIVFSYICLNLRTISQQLGGK